jgi:hypothetical protein
MSKSKLKNMKVVDFGFDFGTSPHGLSADHLEGSGKNLEADNLQSLADQQGEAAQKKPKIYSDAEVRSSCRQVRGAELASRAQARQQGRHTLRLDDAEFLHLVFAVERARNKMRNAVAKGLADFEDLQATRSLWDKLQVLRANRMRGFL